MHSGSSDFSREHLDLFEAISRQIVEAYGDTSVRAVADFAAIQGTGAASAAADLSAAISEAARASVELLASQSSATAGLLETSTRGCVDGPLAANARTDLSPLFVELGTTVSESNMLLGAALADTQPWSSLYTGLLGGAGFLTSSDYSFDGLTEVLQEFDLAAIPDGVEPREEHADDPLVSAICQLSDAVTELLASAGAKLASAPSNHKKKLCLVVLSAYSIAVLHLIHENPDNLASITTLLSTISAGLIAVLLTND